MSDYNRKTMTTEYDSLLKQAASLLENESDPIANAANLAALIFHGVETINWAGFYFLREDELVLGPFAGQVACTRIALGAGVCGTAFSQNQTLVVHDVHKFAGHIACDAASESEIVVPFKHSRVSGVLDIDSPVIGRFAEPEKAFFEAVSQIYLQSLGD
jgi:GAF domain-containing protein